MRIVINQVFLPFPDEVCQLLGGNLTMLHIVVEHIKAIIFFPLYKRQKKDTNRSFNRTGTT